MERQYYYGIDVILAEAICFFQPEIPSEFLKKFDMERLDKTIQRALKEVIWVF